MPFPFRCINDMHKALGGPACTSVPIRVVE
jgi:hypothetical protein